MITPKRAITSHLAAEETWFGKELYMLPQLSLFAQVGGKSCFMTTLYDLTTPPTISLTFSLSCNSFPFIFHLSRADLSFLQCRVVLLTTCADIKSAQVLFCWKGKNFVYCSIGSPWLNGLTGVEKMDRQKVGYGLFDSHSFGKLILIADSIVVILFRSAISYFCRTAHIHLTNISRANC
jgi:hypothetical protein